MLDNSLSLAILGAVISVGGYTLYRIDVWGRKVGLLKDE